VEQLEHVRLLTAPTWLEASRLVGTAHTLVVVGIITSHLTITTRDRNNARLFPIDTNTLFEEVYWINVRKGKKFGK
jgi:hypothetical protein